MSDTQLIDPRSHEPSAIRATWMLVLVTLLWGLSFPLMKDWQSRAQSCPGGAPVASFTMIALRMALALVALALAQPRLFLAPGRRAHQVGILVSLPFFAGFSLQVVGLAWTTPAMSAFITSLGSAWVPLLTWSWFRMHVPAVAWVGAFLGIVGTAVLGVTWDSGVEWGYGEALTLASSFMFSIEILMLDRLGRTINSSHVTPAFMTSTGAQSLIFGVAAVATGTGFSAADLSKSGCVDRLAAWAAWTGSMLQEPAILWDLGLLTFFCTFLAFHWMNVYQPRVGASRAALIYLLEPLFAAAFSIPLGGDTLTLRLLAGGGLILAEISW